MQMTRLQAFLLACVLGAAAAFYTQCDTEDIDPPQPRGRTLIQENQKNSAPAKPSKQKPISTNQVAEEEEEAPRPKAGKALIQGGASNGDSENATEEPDLAGVRDPTFLQDVLKMRLTPEVKAVMDTVKNMIEPLFTTIEEASANDTQLVDGLHSQFSSVNTTFETGLNDSSARDAAIDAARREHKHCRNVPETDLIAEVFHWCNVAESSQIRQGHGLLSLFNAHNTQASDFQPKTIGTFRADMTQSVLSDLLTKTQTYIAANAAFESGDVSMKEEQAKCSNSTALHTAKVQECDDLQKKFQDLVCDYQSHVNTTCSVYQDDYSRLHSNYLTVSASVQTRASDRKVEWTHLKKVHCVARQMASLSGDGSVVASLSPVMDCYNKTVNTDHLTIPERNAPAMSTCPDAPTRVCSPEWMTKEYNSLSSDSWAARCVTSCGSSPDTDRVHY